MHIRTNLMARSALAAVIALATAPVAMAQDDSAADAPQVRTAVEN